MEKKLNLLGKIKTVLLILAIGAFLFGVVTSYKAGKERSYERAAQEIEITITNKINKRAYSDSVSFDFSFLIKNGSDLSLDTFAGVMKISDAEGKLLSTGEATFRGEILPGEESMFTLTWEEDNENGADIWYADFAQLAISFRITEVCFEDEYEMTEVECKEQVKPCDSEALSAKEASYTRALALYEQGKYAEATVLFEQLGHYKDSYEYYLDSASRADAAALDAALDAAYSEGLALYQAEKYGEALEKLATITGYKDTDEKIAEIYAAAEAKADSHAAVGDYASAVAVLRDIGYGQKYGTMYEAYNYASQGLFADAVKSGLKVVFIPEGTEIIPDNYFHDPYDSGRYSLEKVVLPDSILSIGNMAFRNCRKLTEINLPNGLVAIGDSAFSDCSSLVSITLPDSVLSIGNSAFADCTSLRTVKLSAALQTIDNSAFSGCASMTSVSLPSHLILLGEHAFNGCTSLPSVTVPGSIKEIGDSAFYGCSKLASVTLSEGVEVIGTGAFRGCSMLTVLSLPSTLTEIGFDAFRECATLTSVTIPAQVKTIRPNAFADCGALNSAYFDNKTGWTLDGRDVSVTDPAQNATKLKEAKNSSWGTWKRQDS